MERYYFSLVCTFRNVINFFEVKVDVQKGTLKAGENIDIRCASFVQFTLFHPNVMCFRVRLL